MLLNAHEYLEKDKNGGGVGGVGGSSPKRRARSGHRCHAMEIAELTSHPGAGASGDVESSALYGGGSGSGSGNEADVDTNSSNSGGGESHDRRRHKARHQVK